MKLNKYIDHTLLKADALENEIIKLCNEAIKYDFATVCVNGYWTKFVKEILKNSNVKITNVIGFPLGATPTEVKVFETKKAISDGADEIDMVMNIAAFKEKKYEYVLEEMREIRKAAKDKILKCIFENCLLTKEEIKIACELAIKAKLDFVKTSTGFNKSGATIEDIKLMKEVCDNQISIKAAGGIRTYEDAIAMIDNGADRLGTSGGVQIVNKLENDKEY